LHKFFKTARALSINGKRIDINLEDVLSIAEALVIKNLIKIIEEGVIPEWNKIAHELRSSRSCFLSIIKDLKL
jgi:serine/threonine-protein kinase HipA